MDINDNFHNCHQARLCEVSSSYISNKKIITIFIYTS